MARIDVVIPNYNYGRYLRMCLQSVLTQEKVAVRVLVLDNASTDDSAQVAREFSGDSRVELRLRSENLGTHASFNEGIDWAESEYFLLLFSDDYLVQGALSRALNILDADAAVAFCYGRDIAIHDNDFAVAAACPQGPPKFQIHDGATFIRRFCRQGVFQIPGSSVVVRTSIQKRVGHYRATLPHSDDYEIWLRLATHGSVAQLHCVQVGLRTHDHNRSRAFASRQSEHIIHTAAAAISFFDNEGSRLDNAQLIRRRAMRGLASRAYWSGVSHLVRAKAEALPLFKLAFKMSPATAILPPLDYLTIRPELKVRFAFAAFACVRDTLRRLYRR